MKTLVSNQLFLEAQPCEVYMSVWSLGLKLLAT